MGDELKRSSAAPDDCFGNSFAVSGTVVVAGAYLLAESAERVYSSGSLPDA
ncbi:MAG: hypothetical protein ACLQVK_21015 [Acidimicrobiales bacterium]|jgi:hypothetical protein